MSMMRLKSLINDKPKGVKESKINEDVLSSFAQAAMEVGLSTFEVILINVLVFISTVVITFATAMGAKWLSDLVKDAQRVYKDWNDKQKLNPQEIKRIISRFESKLGGLDKDKRKFFVSLINRMKRTNPKDKSALLPIKRDMERYAKEYEMQEQNRFKLKSIANEVISDVNWKVLVGKDLVLNSDLILLQRETRHINIKARRGETIHIVDKPLTSQTNSVLVSYKGKLYTTDPYTLLTKSDIKK